MEKILNAFKESLLWRENGRQAFTFSHASHHAAAAAAVAAAKQLLVMEGTAQAQLRGGIPWWKILFVNAGLAISFKMILTQSIIHYRFWFNSSKIFADLGSKNQYDGSLHVNDICLTRFGTLMVNELPPLFAYFVRAQHFVEPLNDAKDSARRTEGLTECHGAKRREHYTRITLPLSLCRLFRRPFRCRSALLCALAAIAACLPACHSTNGVQRFFPLLC